MHFYVIILKIVPCPLLSCFSFLKNNFIYLFIFGCTGSSLLQRLFSSCRERGLLFSCYMRASHCSGFSFCRVRALGLMGFSCCGTPALLPHSMWDLPRPGIEPMSPALAGRFLTSLATRETYLRIFNVKNVLFRTSLVIQWLRGLLPMQETQVQSLVRELRFHMLQGN